MKQCIFLVCMVGSASALFDYDRAVSAAQKEQWGKAGEEFKTLVTAHPDQPDLLYDAGVVAFKNEDFDQAKALFESAAEHGKAPSKLKEQAYFNKANTHVKQEQLKEALGVYEQVLMLNPENEQASHNVDVVKKMLRKKEQEQQKQQQDKQNKDQNKDQQDKQDSEQQGGKDQSKQDKNDQQRDDRDDKQKQDQSQQDASDEQDSSASEDQSETSKKNQQKENQQKQEGDDKSLDQEGNDKDNERDRPEQEKRKPRQQQQRRRRNEPEKDSQKEKQTEQQQDDHQASLDKEKQQAEQQAQEQNMQAAEKEQDSGKEGFAPIQLDPSLERVLARREDRDAQLNKQIIKALVSETAGRDGQNAW